MKPYVIYDELHGPHEEHARAYDRDGEYPIGLAHVADEIRLYEVVLTPSEAVALAENLLKRARKAEAR